MAKPRTNYDACAYWADSILEDEPRARIEVNSIIVANDVVYSFGHHYPMGMAVRDDNGRVRTVILNADFYPSRGFANTPGDQSNVRSLAHDAVSRAKWRIEVKMLYLSGYSLDSRRGVQVRPRADDPEPDWAYMEVPTYFHANDPGPEPVDDGVGCIAGTSETFEAQDDSYIWGDREIAVQDQAYVLEDRNAPPPGAFPTNVGTGTYAGYRHAFITTTHWGEEDSQYRWNSELPSGDTYRQCPHCAAFQARHKRWHVQMFGPAWGRDRDRGWKLYSEMIAQHGDERGWREARREDWRRVRRAREAHKAWIARNYIPLDAVSTVRVNGVSVPKVDNDGFAYYKDAEAYWKRQRDAERAERRRQRAHEARLREQRQLERFKRGMRRRRRPGFIELANEATNTLVSMREAIDARNNNSQPQSEETT